MINLIIKEINSLIPYDAIEKQHIQETLEWVQSGTPIFRTHKPDVPPKHLVSYCVIVDILEEELLLVDHKLAQLWLPAGGHVDLNENPRETAARECKEELSIDAEFLQKELFFYLLI